MQEEDSGGLALIVALVVTTIALVAISTIVELLNG